MSSLELAETSVRDGDPEGALKQLTAAVKTSPADAKLRVFLFQLLCVLGKWDRALTQLELCAEMDVSALAMREMYREAIGCERLRDEVFAGRKSPMLFGEPEGWIALLIESLIRSGRGEAAEAARLTVAFSYHDDFAASVNDPEATAIMEHVMESLGMAYDDSDLPMRASEDFGRFGHGGTRSAMMFLGAGVETPALHNPDYDFPDSLIPVGVQLFHRITRDLLG